MDGAVVERGKPHLVQDAAVQVFTAGRNLRATLAAEQRANYHRRRRQSWHDLNEYHSVPYHQYTRSIRLGSHELIQCDLDQQPSTIDEPMLLDLDDQTIEEEYSINITGPELLRETIHRSWTPPDRVLHSIPTPTRYPSHLLLARLRCIRNLTFLFLCIDFARWIDRRRLTKASFGCSIFIWKRMKFFSRPL